MAAAAERHGASAAIIGERDGLSRGGRRRGCRSNASPGRDNESPDRRWPPHTPRRTECSARALCHPADRRELCDVSTERLRSGAIRVRAASDECGRSEHHIADPASQVVPAKLSKEGSERQLIALRVISASSTWRRLQVQGVKRCGQIDSGLTDVLRLKPKVKSGQRDKVTVRCSLFSTGRRAVRACLTKTSSIFTKAA
jgi:hypothetical protein